MWGKRGCKQLSGPQLDRSKAGVASNPVVQQMASIVRAGSREEQPGVGTILFSPIVEARRGITQRKEKSSPG